MRHAAAVDTTRVPAASRRCEARGPLGLRLNGPANGVRATAVRHAAACRYHTPTSCQPAACSARPVGPAVKRSCQRRASHGHDGMQLLSIPHRLTAASRRCEARGPLGLRLNGPANGVRATAIRCAAAVNCRLPFPFSNDGTQREYAVRVLREAESAIPVVNDQEPAVAKGQGSLEVIAPAGFVGPLPPPFHGGPTS